MIFGINSIQNPKQDDLTIVSVTKEFVQEPRGVKKLFVEPIVTFFKWGDWYEYPFSETTRSVQWAFSRAKTFLEWETFPSDLTQFINSEFELIDNFFLGGFSDLGGKIIDAFVHFTEAIGPAKGIAKIGHQDQLLSLSSYQLWLVDVLGGMASLSILISACEGLQKQLEILLDPKTEDKKYNLAMLKAAGKVCLMGIGIFGVASFFCVELAAKVVLLTISTVFLLLSILAHFYEKIHRLDIEKSVAK